MTLEQAYKKWSSDPQNIRLYTRTKNDFKTVFKDLDMSSCCSGVATAPRDLKRIIKKSKALRPAKASAASIITQVLEYAHKIEPEKNAKPVFVFSDLTAEGETDKDAEVQKEIVTVSVTERAKDPVRQTTPKSGMTAPKKVVQIHPDTLGVVATYPSANAAKRAAGVSSGLDYSIKNRTLKGGFYWAFEEDFENGNWAPAPTSTVIAARLRKNQPVKKTKPARKRHKVVKTPSANVSDAQPLEKPSASSECLEAPIPAPPAPDTETAEGTVTLTEEKVIPTPLITRIDTKVLEQLSDDELIDELDRRRFFGQLSKKVAEHRYVTYTLESPDDPNGNT